MNIDVKAFFGCALLDEHLLSDLQAIIAEHLPGWAAVLRVYDPRIKGLSIDMTDPLTLFKAIQAEVTAPKSAFYQKLERQIGQTAGQRICGSVELRGAKKSLTIVIDVDEKRFIVAPGIGRWGNTLGFQIQGKWVDGVAAEIFARDLFHEV